MCCIFLVFIVYTKEQHDPQGDRVLSLSDLLNNCGIDCTIDHYHTIEDISDWSYFAIENILSFSLQKIAKCQILYERIAQSSRLFIPAKLDSKTYTSTGVYSTRKSQM